MFVLSRTLLPYLNKYVICYGIWLVTIVTIYRSLMPHQKIGIVRYNTHIIQVNSFLWWYAPLNHFSYKMDIHISLWKWIYWLFFGEIRNLSFYSCNGISNQQLRCNKIMYFTLIWVTCDCKEQISWTTMSIPKSVCTCYQASHNLLTSFL